MSDWTSDAADQLERVVTEVRDRTVEPARAAARAIVLGLVVAFLVAAAAVLVAIAMFRLLVVPLPVWAAWLVLGGIFVIAGVFLWSRRRVEPTED